MKKVLPLCINPLITSECWTFYKFAILQTEPTHKDWIVNFMRVWTDEKGNSIFGDYYQRFQPSYYNEILEIWDENIWTLSSDNLIEYLKKRIDKNEYIVLDVNYNRILNRTEFRLHEILIYGYDEENECFFSPILDNYIFKEKCISYDAIVDAYREVIEYFKNNKDKLWERRNWFYGITLIKPKKYFKKTNEYFDFIKKIHDERVGYVNKRQIVSAEFSELYSHTSYTGITSLLLLNRLLEKAKYSEEYWENTKYNSIFTCLKLYEHQRIIYMSMDNFINEFNVPEELKELAKDYKKQYEKLYLIYMILQKLNLSYNVNLFEKIPTKLISIHKAECEILEKFELQAKKIYIQQGLCRGYSTIDL